MILNLLSWNYLKNINWAEDTDSHSVTYEQFISASKHWLQNVIKRLTIVSPSVPPSDCHPFKLSSDRDSQCPLKEMQMGRLLSIRSG